MTLTVENLTCCYGDIVAVDGVSFEVSPGEILGVIGANGAGKTTVINSVAGLVKPRSGSIAVNGRDISCTPVHRRVSHGIGLVPEGRRVFPDLTVEENLIVGATQSDRRTLQSEMRSVFNIFSRLEERRTQLAGHLSGGEQQMLAVGRALMARPTVLLIDELSLGLMPIAIEECYRALHALRETGLAVLLVEQSTERVIDAADRIAIMELGRVAWIGSGDDATKDNAILRTYLGLGEAHDNRRSG